MALQTSGQISMNDIRTELGIPSQAPFSLNNAEDGVYVLLNQCSTSKPSPNNPAAMSEWYGYCHTCSCGTFDCFTTQNEGSGGKGFYIFTITLGSSTGTVYFEYEAYGIPDKYVVTYNGVDVIDTGFVSSFYPSDTFNLNLQNAALTALGYPAISATSPGTASFTKSSSTPTTATVKVTAPLDGTAWRFRLGCPLNAFSLKYSSTSCNDACSGPFTTTYYSTCTTLGLSCSIYTAPWSTPITGNPIPLGAPGYYSDGTNCYYIASNEIVSITTCLTNVYITLCADDGFGSGYADASGNIRIVARSNDGSNPINVDTGLTIGFQVMGGNGGNYSNSIVIGSGDACGEFSFGAGFDPFESISFLTITSIAPSSSSTQLYIQSTTSIGSCTSC